MNFIYKLAVVLLGVFFLNSNSSSGQIITIVAGKENVRVPDISRISGNSHICLGNSETLIDSNTGGVWRSGDTVVAVVDSLSGIVNSLTAGTALISYVFGSSFDTIRVYVDTFPNPGVVYGPNVACIGTLIPLTITSNGGGLTEIGPNTITTSNCIAANFPGVDSVFYEITNSCGTAFSPALVVRVDSYAYAGVIIAPDSICVAHAEFISDSVTDGVWSISNSNVYISGGYVWGNFPGTDTIQYKQTNSCGSDSTIHIIKVISGLPDAGNIIGDTTICIGSVTIVTDGVAGGVWGSMYSAIATVDITGNVQGISAGVDTVVYTVTNACGSFSTQMPITIVPRPNAGVITGNDSVCQGSTIVLANVVTGGVWSAYNSNVAVFDSSITGVATGWDTIVYTVSSGWCTDSAIKKVKVLSLPYPGGISGGNVCKGGTETLLSSASGGTWTMSNSMASITSIGGVVTGISLGTDTVTYTVTNMCGSEFTTKEISVDTTAYVASISGNMRVCVGATDTLKDSISGGVWMTTSALAAVTPYGSIGVVSGIIAGVDTVMYGLINGCGLHTVLFVIRVDSFPVTGGIVCKDSVCQGASITFKDTVAASMGTRYWSVKDSLLSIISGVLHGVSPGRDTLLLTIVNSCGFASTEKSVLVKPASDPGTINGPDTLCVGFPATYFDTTANCKGYWNTGTMSANSLSTYISAAQVGFVNLKYNVRNNCGGNSITKMVQVLAAPNSLVTSGPKDVCLGATVSLANFVKGGMWSATNSNTSIDWQSGVLTGNNIGTDTIVYIVANRCGADTSYYNETVHSYPVQPVIKQKNNLLSVDSIYSTYQWNLDGVPIAGATHDTFTLSSTGLYQVWVSNNYGCSVVSHFREVTTIAPCEVKDMMIYPNPATNKLYISWCAFVNVGISTMDGRVLMAVNHADNIDISALANGNYMMSVYDDYGKRIATTMFTKNAK